MKTISAFILASVVLVSCGKIETNEASRVDKFVQELKQNEYTDAFLPQFVPEEIPYLLEYADDFREIDRFPVNLYSSFYPQSFRLGECLLWTIESIRISHGNSDKFSSFPSLVPIAIEVSTRNEYASMEVSEDELYEIFQLYLNWWNDNKERPFEDFRGIDPLDGYNYDWK